MPGTITRNVNSIFGTAAMSGVRCAAFIESAAIARWTTRKSVHQYPKDKTKPRPITIPNHSTPIGLASARPRYDHECTSAIYNEVLQFFLIVFGFLPVAYLGLRDAGGWAGLGARVPDTFVHSWSYLGRADAN